MNLNWLITVIAIIVIVYVFSLRYDINPLDVVSTGVSKIISVTDFRDVKENPDNYFNKSFSLYGLPSGDNTFSDDFGYCIRIKDCFGTSNAQLSYFTLIGEFRFDENGLYFACIKSGSKGDGIFQVTMMEQGDCIIPYKINYTDITNYTYDKCKTICDIIGLMSKKYDTCVNYNDSDTNELSKYSAGLGGTLQAREYACGCEQYSECVTYISGFISYNMRNIEALLFCSISRNVYDLVDGNSNINNPNWIKLGTIDSPNLCDDVKNNNNYWIHEKDLTVWLLENDYLSLNESEILNKTFVIISESKGLYDLSGFQELRALINNGTLNMSQFLINNWTLESNNPICSNATQGYSCDFEIVWSNISSIRKANVSFTLNITESISISNKQYSIYEPVNATIIQTKTGIKI